MWSLDLALAALAGLILYLIVTQLRFDDPRWLFNAWTYAIAVPTIALILAIVLRSIASRYVKTSVQLGFLFSVFLHLVLVILAINVVIFSRYFPDAFAGIQPERSPIRRTVPEYVFQTQQQTVTTPDWSEPVDSQTASPVIPQEQRQLPPVEHTTPKLEVPQPRDPQQVPLQQFLMKRTRPSHSQPQPADSPAKRARQRSDQQAQSQAMESPTTAPIPVEPVPTESITEATSSERQIDESRPRQSASLRSDLKSMLPSPAAADLPLRSQAAPSLSAARSQSRELPTVGESGLTQQRRQPDRANRVRPAGSAPALPTVAVARFDEFSSRLISPVDVPMTRRGRTSGAQLVAGEQASSTFDTTHENVSGSELARNDLASRAGLPRITLGQARQAPGRSTRRSTGIGFAPAGTPSAAGATSGTATSDAATLGTARSSAPGGSEQIADRTESGDLDAGRRSRPGSPSRPLPGPPRSNSIAAAGPTLDLILAEGPVGLAEFPRPNAGVVPSADQPQIASLELSRVPRPRREVGGPATPAGSKIAAVESFSRRVMRTRGGAPPSPSGQVGPATEEAIERGLAYLASTQNEDGSWSLQGHGEDVLLHSDSAATGLCLLAFQGAGYTHRQHQYADTVSRGLQFLLKNQRTNGDLYRVENQLSNRNVALYSHGIASLALCEAYGMTQDGELKVAAQAALRFIVNTQHRQRGGWRYSPQVSSDTSVTGWMMMSLKSGELSGLEVPKKAYDGINGWLGMAQSPQRRDRYRYNPFAPDTPTQRHGRTPTPTMTAVGMLMRMYSGWRRDKQEMKSAADYLLKFPPQMGNARSPQRDTYYWYYATQVMFHMGGKHWQAWNQHLNPLLLESQVTDGPAAGSWDPARPVVDRWSPHAGRLYVTTMNLLNLEVFYRHLPIYEDTAE